LGPWVLNALAGEALAVTELRKITGGDDDLSGAVAMLCDPATNTWKNQPDPDARIPHDRSGLDSMSDVGVCVERRVFVSVNSDRSLDSRRRAVKQAVIDRLVANGFSPQVFFERGLPLELSWSFENVERVMTRCVGALVIGFPRWRVTPQGGEPVKLVGDYSHVEGAIAYARGLPTLVASEDGVLGQGIVYRGGTGRTVARLPADLDPVAVFDGEFGNLYSAWLSDLSARRDIFLGFCSKAAGTASQVQLLLERAGATVQNWAMDFGVGASILQEIERARSVCTRAVFVFSEDDPLEGAPGQAAPRDNVVFEAGYFIHAKGKDRVLVVREQGAKMPADLGGDIYAALPERSDIGPILDSLRRFVAAL
jgi:hypothetical protein